jgi:hypothetical protein
MIHRIINFLKYNNATILIVAAIFLVTSGVFAQTETGQALIGGEQTKIEGVDNTLLLAADLDNLAMDFKIEKIEEDEAYYYVTYTFIDLTEVNSAWQYQLQEKVKKISKKSKVDLGKYLAEEFTEESQARLKELREVKAGALAEGETKREEVVAYSGLIGQTLDLANKLFPAYQPVKRNELPSPENFIPQQPDLPATPNPDSLTDIYNQYINENDPDNDNIFGDLDNCPQIANPDQLDSNDNGQGDACDDDLTPFIKGGTEGGLGNEGGLDEESTPGGTEEGDTGEVSPLNERGDQGGLGATGSGTDTTPSMSEEPSVEIIDLPVAGPETPISE